MNDITMCATTTCVNRHRCFRFLAEPDSHYQSYSDFTDLCFLYDYEMLMKLREGDKYDDESM